jgi:hypothetical protein
MSNDSEKEKLELLRTLMDQAFEDIKGEMKRLKLDRGKARGCIERSIDELVRRRPVHEEAVNRRQDRILSIGQHCGKRGLAWSGVSS